MILRPYQLHPCGRVFSWRSGRLDHHSCLSGKRMGRTCWTRPVPDSYECPGLLVHLPYVVSSTQNSSFNDSGFCSSGDRTVSSSVAWRAREVVQDG